MRARTTKALAKRIELDYYRRTHPLRSWMGRISWAAGGLTAAGIAWALLPSGRIVWSGGNLTPAHAFFQSDCASCHGSGLVGRDHPGGEGSAAVGRADAGIGPVTDAACSACHAGTQHRSNQTHTPACAACHIEHEGRSLLRVDDSRCADCHAALTTTSGPPAGVARAVTSFPAGHPEFDAVAAGHDGALLRLNHHLHLKTGLRGPSGPVTLVCGSCHAPDDAGRLMRPVAYQAHCASCHPLTFDSEGRFPAGTVVPHGDPRKALDFLLDIYSGRVIDDPAATRLADPAARALALQRSRRARLEPAPYVPLSIPSGSERAFVIERVGLAVALLQRQTCALCHGPAVGAPPLPAAAPPPMGGSILPPPPDIAKPEVPQVWMSAAAFSHRAHRNLTCAACHPDAATSERTGDVLMPGKMVCAACHGPDGGAPATCVTCHRYHSPEKDRLAPSRFAIPRRS